MGLGKVATVAHGRVIRCPGRSQAWKTLPYSLTHDEDCHVRSHAWQRFPCSFIVGGWSPPTWLKYAELHDENQHSLFVMHRILHKLVDATEIKVAAR